MVATPKEKPMTSISVVIPAYNKLTEVLACLTSLQTFASREVEMQFLVQDDCSPDVFFPAVIPQCAASTARNPQNRGFSGNCNAGAARAQGDILFFVNQDVVALGQDADGNPLSQRWDIPLVEAFDKPEVGIVGAKLLFPDGHIQSCGGEYDAHGQPFHRCLGYANYTAPDVNTPQSISWVTGAALAIRRDVFVKMGGFDEGYERGYFEDVDLCERIKEAGFKVWYEPRTQLIHHVGTTGGNPLFMQNALRFKQKWVDTKKVIPDTYAVKLNWW